jgi:hypothetical protein
MSLLWLSQFTTSFSGSGTITNIPLGFIRAIAIGLKIRSLLTGIVTAIRGRGQEVADVSRYQAS